MTATTIILVGLLLCILFAVLHLIAIAQRIEKGITSVVRILAARKEELEVLEIELKGIHKLLALSGADKEDIKRMEEIEEKITEIGLSSGDHVLLYQDDDDFEVEATLYYKFVDPISREGWVAYPNWSTLTRKPNPP